jgi:hypothetical protein
MSCDSRLRDGLRQAVAGHDLREEIALEHVKATHPTGWGDFTVGTVEDLAAPRSQHARVHRIVGAVAACALLAGAVALPLALRNRAGGPAPRPASQPVTTGYRSTVTVRVGPPPSQRSTPTTRPLGITLADPVHLALASGTRNTALRESHLPSNDPGIDFHATSNAAGDLLSLTVITPTANETTTLARNWALTFVDARKADARRQIIEERHNLTLRVTALRSELLRIDTQLVKLEPGTYKDVLQYDFPGPLPGRRTTPPPPVPEQGSVKTLDLAFERIQLLSSLTQSSSRPGDQSLASPTPWVFGSVVSQTPAVEVKPPHRHSHTSTLLIAVGLLLAGLGLAASALWLRRRSRRPSPSQLTDLDVAQASGRPL